METRASHLDLTDSGLIFRVLFVLFYFMFFFFLSFSTMTQDLYFDILLCETLSLEPSLS